jgi:hypothetical protein
MLEPYLHSLVCGHCVVLNQLSPGIKFQLFLLLFLHSYLQKSVTSYLHRVAVP